MSKYIEFDVVIQKKSKRKTRRKRGGGDITNCDLTPLTWESDQLTPLILMDKLFSKIELPVTYESMIGVGGSNLVMAVDCESSHIVCRVLTNGFRQDEKHIYTSKGNRAEFVLSNFANEVNAMIYFSECQLSPVIYDVQSMNSPLLQSMETLSNLSQKDKIEIFGEHAVKFPEYWLYICLFMEKGEPYKATTENFQETMELFDRIAEATNNMCLDVKADNLVLMKEVPKIIDLDPYFMMNKTILTSILLEKEIDIPENEINHLMSSVMKYLFCMHVIIHTEILDETFQSTIMEQLTTIARTIYSSQFPFLFIMKHLYENHEVLKQIIDNYHFDNLSQERFGGVEPCLVDCERKLGFISWKKRFINFFYPPPPPNYIPPPPPHTKKHTFTAKKGSTPKRSAKKGSTPKRAPRQKRSAP